MSARPGTFLWFVAHDLRQSRRSFFALFGASSPLRIALILGFVILAVHVAAWPVAQWFGILEGEPGGVEKLTAYTASGVLFVLPWIIANAMTATTRALYARGDLELILASPASARSVLAARTFATAADSVGSVAILLLPLANVNALAGHWHWLAIYPALAASGLFGSGVGIMAALTLFKAVGPRRARLVSQIAATGVAGIFVLGAQATAVMPGDFRARVFAALTPGPDSSWTGDLLWALVRAPSGDLGALALWALLAVVVFIASALLFGENFARAAIVSAGAPAASGRLVRKASFSGDIGKALRAKERRLVLRDPWLLSQLMLQIVYTLPVSVILWRNGGVTGTVGIAFAPTIVVVAGQLAGALAWVALSGEDAPDFLATAPITRGRIDRGKLSAIALPVGLVLALPIASLSVASPWSGFCAATYALGAGASAALVNLWRQAPARRGLVLRRHSQSKLVGLLEHLLSISWAVAAGAATLQSWTTMVPLAVVAATLWFCRPRAFTMPTSALPRVV